MHQITVGNLVVEIVRKKIKNLHLAVYPPDGRIRVAAPLRIDDEAVRLMIISRFAWIKKHQTKFQNQTRQTPREYVSGESHYFKGERYLLEVIYRDAAPSVEIHKKRYLTLYARPNSDRDQRAKILARWYREQLKAEIPVLLEKWLPIVGVSIQDWGVKQMKTKWGTCNILARRIWLNLELIKKPTHCLEYVLVHELVHLLERNHNERFRAYMNKFLPQWDFLKSELNKFIL
jgi:predicted metal-dependent hydrolase